MLDQPLADAGLPAAAARVGETAAKHAAEAELSRELAPEVVKAVLDAGFARHFVPARWGGRLGSLSEATSAVLAVSEKCPSTGWYASLTAALGRMAAYLPVSGQAELWADGPDPLIVGALMPLGKARPVDGGWRVSGSWSLVSAVRHSAWALVCGIVSDESRQARFFAVPRRAYQVLDTWYNVGMRATGSNTLVLDDVFVPTDRSFTRDLLAQGSADGSDATCHQVPLRAVNCVTFAAPIVGAARGALASWSEWVLEKLGEGAPPGVAGGDRASYEGALARSAAEIDAAELLLERAAAVADAGRVTPLLVARNTRDCAFAVDLAVGAVDRLFRSAGTRGQSESHPLQRYWRDVNAAATHIVLRFEPAAAAYAAQALAS